MQVNTEKTELALKAASTEVSLFVENAQKEVEALEAQYATLVPDASTKKGYDDCKAVRRDLLPIKSSLESARKTLKAPILAAGKLVDSTMNPLAERVEALYKPFESAYRKVDEEKKQREEKRLARIQAGFDELNQAVITASGSSSSVIQAVIDDVSDFDVDPKVFQEKADEIIRAHEATMQKLAEMLMQANQIEEMEAKQKAIEEREKAIAEKELAEKLKAEAELEKQKQKERELELAKAREEAQLKAEQEAKERHARELEEAEARAAERERQAVEAERKRQEAEQAEIERLKAKREADLAHKASIHNEIVKCLLSTGITEEQAKAVVTLAAKRQAANLYINY